MMMTMMMLVCALKENQFFPLIFILMVHDLQQVDKVTYTFFTVLYWFNY